MVRARAQASHKGWLLLLHGHASASSGAGTILMPGIKALTGYQGTEWVLHRCKVCVACLVLRLLPGLRPSLA